MWDEPNGTAVANRLMSVGEMGRMIVRFILMLLSLGLDWKCLRLIYGSLACYLLRLSSTFFFSTKCRIYNSRYGNYSCKFHLKYCTIGTVYLSGLLKIKCFLASNVQAYLVCNI